MNNATKLALEASLKRLLAIKPFKDITISDLADDCGISRMTFYYHFKDIYDLLEWSCLRDAKEALAGKKTYDTWQEGLQQIFEAVLENKPLILNVYRNVGRAQIENFLYQLTYELLLNVIKETQIDIAPEDQEFIAHLYKYAFVGIMLDWIGQGMREDYQEITRRVSIALDGVLVRSAENFRKN